MHTLKTHGNGQNIRFCLVRTRPLQGNWWIFHEAPPHATEKFQGRYIQRIHNHNNKRNASSFPYILYAVTRLFTLIILKQQMFTPDQTGRQASPHLDLEKTVCGSCAICKLRLNSSADPRLLPCLHTVCNTCLTKICTDGATQGKSSIVVVVTVWLILLGRSGKSNSARDLFKIALNCRLKQSRKVTFNLHFRSDDYLH